MTRPGEGNCIRKSKAIETSILCARREEGRVRKTRANAVLPATGPHGDNNKRGRHMVNKGGGGAVTFDGKNKGKLYNGE